MVHPVQQESFQKALRSLETGCDGWSLPRKWKRLDSSQLVYRLRVPNPERVLVIKQVGYSDTPFGMAISGHGIWVHAPGVRQQHRVLLPAVYSSGARNSASKAFGGRCEAKCSEFSASRVCRRLRTG